MIHKTIKFHGVQFIAGLLIGISLLFILTLTSLPEQAHAQEEWLPFNFRLTPSYQEGKITYNIRFSNQLENALTDVTIKIPLPEGTRFLEAGVEPSASVTFDGKEITFFASVVHSPIRQAYFTVEVTDPQTPIYTTHAWISWKGDSPGQYITEDESIDITLQSLNWQAPPSPRLQLQASALVTGTDIIYTIYPQNVSNRRMWDLQITMSIPEETQFLSAEAPPSFVTGSDGQIVTFSTIEMEKQVEATPLRFRVSTSGTITPFLVSHAWATWKNAGRGVGERIAVEEGTRTGDIVVQPGIPQLVVSDLISDTPFGNYDLASVALQDIAQGDETNLRITFYTTETLGPVGDQPLRFILWIDSDCSSDTGQSMRNIGADYRVTYIYDKDRSRLDSWNAQEAGWDETANLNGLTGGKMVTTWVPYQLINNSNNFCWVARASNNTKMFDPGPPSDWLPHWSESTLGQYEKTTGVLTPSQLNILPPIYGMEGIVKEIDGNLVNILNIRVNHANDDAEEIISTGKVKTSSSNLQLITDNGFVGQIVGIRFQNVLIPQSAVISNAYLEFQTSESQDNATSLIFYGQAADSALPFTDCKADCYDLSKRPTTITSIPWDNVPAWNTPNEKHQTPNLAAIVQEIVDRDGWASGNSLVFLIIGSGTRTAKAYDDTRPAAAPLLHIEYTTPGSPLLTTDDNEPESDIGTIEDDTATENAAGNE